FRLVTVSNHADADVRWSPGAVRRVVAQSHVGVVPTRPPPVSTAKSNNRVIQLMAAGKPFVAGRIPSYEEVVRQGWNGFLCDSPEEWRAALLELRSPERRAEPTSCAISRRSSAAARGRSSCGRFAAAERVRAGFVIGGIPSLGHSGSTLASWTIVETLLGAGHEVTAVLCPAGYLLDETVP